LFPIITWYHYFVSYLKYLNTLFIAKSLVLFLIKFLPYNLGLWKATLLCNNSLSFKRHLWAQYPNKCRLFLGFWSSSLLLKLWKISIIGNLWCWFKSYLNNKSQCVRLNSLYSTLLLVLSGISQGSILGPLLFFSLYQWLIFIHSSL